jgi:hypothetical protein
MTRLTLDAFHATPDAQGSEARVRAVVEAALADPTRRLRFLSAYTAWNGLFGAGVATLAGKIARARGVFVDPGERVRAIADRSVLVASWFFDAARDEFDDRGTDHRDTHRCLAQALLKGVVLYHRAHGPDALRATFDDDVALDALLAEPAWLAGLNAEVARGYGLDTPDDAASLFRAMGYHLGSELLADEEFTAIDVALEAQDRALVEFLRRTKVDLAGARHTPYHWLRTHSSRGGSVEADHFDWAMQGVRAALQYVPPEAHAALEARVLEGFADFAETHRRFFEHAAALG